MSAGGLVELARAEVDEVERRMMDAPEQIPMLRDHHDQARAALLRAELRQAAEERAQPRVLTWAEKQQLWREFCDARIHLRRSRLSPASKARLISKFGAEHYAMIPWK